MNKLRWSRSMGSVKLLTTVLLVTYLSLCLTSSVEARSPQGSADAEYSGRDHFLFEGQVKEAATRKEAAFHDDADFEDEPIEPPTDRWASMRAEHMERTKARQLAAGGTVRGQGWWSTKGNKIVDQKGNPVYFSGINWDGFEYGNCMIDGVKVGFNRSVERHLAQMRLAGFNLIRLPFAGTCVQPDVYPGKGSVDFVLNPEFKGLTSFEAMVKVVKMAGAQGIRVILDFHRLGPPFGPTYGAEHGMWWNETYPISFWRDTWKFVVQEFVDDSMVVGVDLFNEPHGNFLTPENGPFWMEFDRAPGNNWRAAARQMGNMILDINPNLLICIEGMWQDAWWAENLVLVKELPIKLKVPNKLVYSVHDYGPLLQVQAWHHGEDYPASLVDFWDYNFGFVHDEEIAPVWVGEFGSLFNRTPNAFITKEQARLSDIAEWAWFTTFVDYIRNKSLVWTYFCWSPDAINIGGILADDWKTLRTDKLGVLEPIMYPSYDFLPPLPPPPTPPPSPPPVYETPMVVTSPSGSGSFLAPLGGGAPPSAPPPGKPSGATSTLQSCYINRVLTLLVSIGIALHLFLN